MKNYIEKIKEHIQKHEVLYCCVFTGLGVAGITYVIMRSNASLKYISPGIPGTANLGIPEIGENTSTNIVSNSLFCGKSTVMNKVSYILSDRQGPPSWVVRCKETGNIFTSQRTAALETGVPENELSRHLNGMLEHVRGLHFERICMAA